MGLARAAAVLVSSGLVGGDLVISRGLPFFPSSFTGMASVDPLNSSRRDGEIVRKSIPASALISSICYWSP